jgi:hypothetical protein
MCDLVPVLSASTHPSSYGGLWMNNGRLTTLSANVSDLLIRNDLRCSLMLPLLFYPLSLFNMALFIIVSPLFPTWRVLSYILWPFLSGQRYPRYLLLRPSKCCLPSFGENYQWWGGPSYSTFACCSVVPRWFGILELVWWSLFILLFLFPCCRFAFYVSFSLGWSLLILASYSCQIDPTQFILYVASYCVC